ncbi:unnamed protein product [Rotaria sp. Silwood1]|nr:unnamed protein product [Rotaria sp. Silwood1]CAF4534967.1 unnamed protein product [Rotaria sp. Silwood1]
MDLFYDHIGMSYNFEKYDNTAVDTQNTPYDYGSVMHYGPTAFSKNGLNTIEPLQSGVVIGQRQTLSEIDIQEVRLFYGCSAAGSTLPPTVMNSTTTNTIPITTATATTTTATQQIVPLRAPAIDIRPNAKWVQSGLTVAGENGSGNGINQLYYPYGLYVDDDQTIYIADHGNHRIVERKIGATSGQVVAGGTGSGNGSHQLDGPRDVIVDKERDSLIICDPNNRRVVRWPRRNGTSGETIISNIDCISLTMDENGSLYVVDYMKDEVKRYRFGDTEGTVVAGGNGRGNRLDQLSGPFYVFVDRNHSVYISDHYNNRVVKWEEDAKQGIIVAGVQGQGNSLTQLSGPHGVVVDQLETVYVADSWNHRIMRWPKAATEGSVIVGGYGQGRESYKLNRPWGLSFDQHGNLYVGDFHNHRVQKFNIEQTIN